MKYVVVSGGVVSGLGKGISISSIGVLLKSAGLRVTSIKIDPYLNSDAGTMSPFEHGEVFVLNDGGEADLDLGNYERFLDIALTKDHNITTGKVYSKVIQAERRGDYLGKTVQVVPHVTDAIQDWIEEVSHRNVDVDVVRGGTYGGASASTAAAAAASPPPLLITPAGGVGEEAASPGTPTPDVCLIEVGGTVGDIESLVFLEALRQLAGRVGHDNICFIHVSLVPVLGSVGEQKTKPTQHTVKELRSLGISPDMLICRSGSPLQADTRAKLALFCQVPPDCVLAVHDVPNIYHVPLLLDAQHVAQIIARRLKMTLPCQPVMGPWKKLAHDVDAVSRDVRIALVGKYTGLQDSYLSVIKALQHAAIAAERRLVIDWVDATALERDTAESDPDLHAQSWEAVRAADGVLVPGGFGDRGVPGKIAAVKYARESLKPFLGICLGMQCAVIEFARSKLDMPAANSAEFDSFTPNPVVIFMPEINASQLGGTMRLGARPTTLHNRPDGSTSLARDLYGHHARTVLERHRHRYEVNPEMVAPLQEAGLLFTGRDERNTRMEIVELDPKFGHPFFFACQYHPEFNTHPHCPSPPFLGFILAAAGKLTLPLAFNESYGCPFPLPPASVAGSSSSSSGGLPKSPHLYSAAAAAAGASSLPVLVQNGSPGRGGSGAGSTTSSRGIVRRKSSSSSADILASVASASVAPFEASPARVGGSHPHPPPHASGAVAAAADVGFVPNDVCVDSTGLPPKPTRVPTGGAAVKDLLGSGV